MLRGNCPSSTPASNGNCGNCGICGKYTAADECAVIEYKTELTRRLSSATFFALRGDLLIDIKSELNLENLIGMNDKEILKLLIGNLDIAPIVAKYLTRTMELRDFLMSNPRQGT